MKERDICFSGCILINKYCGVIGVKLQSEAVGVKDPKSTLPVGDFTSE